MRTSLRHTFCILLAALLPTSCAWLERPLNANDCEQTTHFTITDKAQIIPASYGSSCQITGDSIARFPDFSLTKVRSTVICDEHLSKIAGHHDLYQIRSSKGELLYEIELNPNNSKDSTRIVIDGQAYLISGGSQPGSIIISIPPHQFAHLSSLYP